MTRQKPAHAYTITLTHGPGRYHDYGTAIAVYNVCLQLSFCAALVLQIIIPDDIKQTIYISTDEGMNYTGRNIPVDQTSLKIHPTQNGWMLGIDSNHVR